ncbi:MAG: serine/threonine-protein kinase [Zavarzinella sp.]
MAEINETIGGYRLRTLMQTGQVSQVFEVVEPHSNRHFAMKILLPEAASKPEVRQTLFSEAAIGQKLRHENVIHILKVSQSKESPHFIMEYFPSGSLRNRMLNKDFDFLRQHAPKMFRQMATALAYMHGNGYVHCDVKPDNMLVDASGKLKLIDFAISRKIPTGFAKWFYKQPKAQGTPSYMSPEQILRKPLDGRADIYSLAATMYELTTGRPPFRGNTMNDLLSKHFGEKPITPQSHNKDLTDEFSALVLKMLAKKKEDRPPNCHEVLMTLRKIKIHKDDPDDIEQQMGMSMG